MMRTLAIGDIHGRLGMLDALLDAVAPTVDDTVVVLGDFIDGGDDSRGVIERLIELRRSMRLIALRGNHEEMMLEAFGDEYMVDVWKTLGGMATLRSYGIGPRGSLDSVPAEHWTFLRDDCVDYYETGTHIFVHGHAQPDLPMSAQSGHAMRWMRIDEHRGHYSGKTIVCGHAAVDGDRPLDCGHAICIDVRGWLTCLAVESRTVWQIGHDGARRQYQI